MCKILRWIGYASTGVGVIFIIWACVSVICHLSSTAAGCFIRHPKNLFEVANSFLLLGIAMYLVTKHCYCEKCENEDKKKEG